MCVSMRKDTEKIVMDITVLFCSCENVPCTTEKAHDVVVLECLSLRHSNNRNIATTKQKQSRGKSRRFNKFRTGQILLHFHLRNFLTEIIRHDYRDDLWHPLVLQLAGPRKSDGPFGLGAFFPLGGRKCSSQQRRGLWGAGGLFDRRRLADTVGFFV